MIAFKKMTRWLPVPQARRSARAVVGAKSGAVGAVSFENTVVFGSAYTAYDYTFQEASAWGCGMVYVGPKPVGALSLRGASSEADILPAESAVFVSGEWGGVFFDPLEGAESASEWLARIGCFALLGSNAAACLGKLHEALRIAEIPVSTEALWRLVDPASGGFDAWVAFVMRVCPGCESHADSVARLYQEATRMRESMPPSLVKVAAELYAGVSSCRLKVSPSVMRGTRTLWHFDSESAIQRLLAFALIRGWMGAADSRVNGVVIIDRVDSLVSAGVLKGADRNARIRMIWVVDDAARGAKTLESAKRQGVFSRWVWHRCQGGSHESALFASATGSWRVANNFDCTVLDPEFRIVVGGGVPVFERVPDWFYRTSERVRRYA